MVEQTIDHSQQTIENTIWEILENVKDPEIPVLSVVDMGMITGIEVQNPKSEVRKRKALPRSSPGGCRRA